MSFVRFTRSAVDPTDVEEVERLFREDVRPAFEGIDGCGAIELLVSCDSNAGGLVEGCVVSRWSSLEQMEAGLSSRAAQESQVRIRTLMRHEPVSQTFRAVE